jgi:hypothetical protein
MFRRRRKVRLSPLAAELADARTCARGGTPGGRLAFELGRRVRRLRRQRTEQAELARAGPPACSPAMGVDETGDRVS